MLGVDPSEAFVEHATAHVADSRVDFRVAEAGDLPLPDRSVEVVVSGLVLNFVADQPAAAREMRRVLGPGGRVGCYVWDYAGGMQMLRHFWDVAASVDPASREADQGERFEICQPEPLRRLMSDAGFDDVSGRRDRRADGVHRLRGLLVTVPRRPGAGPVVRHDPLGR